MTLTIGRHESQVDFVERVLRTERRIQTWDVLYGLRDDAGNPRSITRLAAIVHTLRHKRGWVIDEHSDPGALATYTVVVEPGMGRARGRVRVCPVCHREHAVGTTCGAVLA